MAFKDIHKLKKIVEVQKENIECDILVIGKDLFSISLYNKLIEKHGDLKVRLLTEDYITLTDFSFKGPSNFRGEVNKKVIEKKFTNVSIESINNPSIFYKDMIWKQFGGRSKPEVLKYDEGFYVDQRIEFKLNDVIDIPAESTIENLNEVAYKVKIKSVKFEDDKVLIECLNGTEFKASKVYFGKSPAYFLNKFEDKSKLSDELIQFCETTQTVQALFVRYDFNRPVSDAVETMFIPLSYTHEWGHYVGEFKSNNNDQSAEFLHFIDKDHTTEEDMSRIIRGLKKSLEKIYDNFSKNISKEFIAIEDEIGCLKIDDSLFMSAKEKDGLFANKFIFVGENAPVLEEWCVELMDAYSIGALSHQARALLVHQEILKNI